MFIMMNEGGNVILMMMMTMAIISHLINRQCCQGNVEMMNMLMMSQLEKGSPVQRD